MVLTLPRVNRGPESLTGVLLKHPNPFSQHEILLKKKKKKEKEEKTTGTMKHTGKF